MDKACCPARRHTVVRAIGDRQSSETGEFSAPSRRNRSIYLPSSVLLPVLSLRWIHTGLRLHQLLFLAYVARRLVRGCLCLPVFSAAVILSTVVADGKDAEDQRQDGEDERLDDTEEDFHKEHADDKGQRHEE